MMGNLERVATFAQCPNASASCLSLASAGFEYSGTSGQVVCPLCGLVIKDSQNATFNPLNEHRVRSPQCPFFSESLQKLADEQFKQIFLSPSPSLHQDSASAATPSAMQEIYQSALERAKRHGAVAADANAETTRDHVPRDVVPIDRANPNYSLLRDESRRLSTFSDWPSSDVVQPLALARAGLFYTGQTDRTCCAFCRGVLHRWQPDDDPKVEHRRHFPDCPFVRQQDVGNVPLQRSLSHQMSALSVGDVSQSTSGVIVSSSAAADATRTLSSCEQAPGAAAAAPSSIRHQTMTTNSSAQQPEQAAMNITSDRDDEERTLMEENRRLHEAKMCKVCMDKEVNTVFLPCGHLVSCDQCSPQLRNCPICRTYIRGTVRTFLA